MTDARIDRAGACPQCGAIARGGRSCREAFDELLAFEFTDREAFGPVHHLTVACYYLQHPAGYGDEIRAMWKQLISAPEDRKEYAVSTMAAMRERFDGATRVREAGHKPPAWWPRAWPHTVLDAVPSDDSDRTASGHVRRVRDWAASVRVTLDIAEGGAHSP